MIIIVKNIVLYLSSYVPLYLLMIGKELFHRFENIINSGNNFNFSNIVWFNSLSDWMIVILLISSILLSGYLYLLINRAKKSGKDDYYLIEIKNETEKHFFNYFALYFMPVIGLSIGKVTDVFILFMIMVIMGSVYVSNDLIYINPLLILGNYKVYTAKVRHVSSNKNIKIDKLIISNCTEIEKKSGQLIKLIKSNSKYTIHYNSTEIHNNIE